MILLYGSDLPCNLRVVIEWMVMITYRNTRNEYMVRDVPTGVRTQVKDLPWHGSSVPTFFVPKNTGT